MTRGLSYRLVRPAALTACLVATLSAAPRPQTATPAHDSHYRRVDKWAQLPPGYAEALERLRTRDLVQQMTVNVENACPVGELLHDVAVPDLVEQRARLCFGHGVSSCYRSGDQLAASVSFVVAGASPEGPVVRARSAMRARLPERPRR